MVGIVIFIALKMRGQSIKAVKKEEVVSNG